MKRSIVFIVVAAATLLFGFATSTRAQSPGREIVTVGPTVPHLPGTVNVTNSNAPRGATVIRPKSSIPQPGSAGKQAHANIEFVIPASGLPSSSVEPLPVAPLPAPNYYETPASLACLYALVPVTTGCNPNVVTTVPTGGSQTIAIVDAFDDPYAAEDLAWFSLYYGIPNPMGKLHVVYASNLGVPPQDYSGGWEMEESLDVEYAHAMAPDATIYLVEAYGQCNSAGYCAPLTGDIFEAINVATNYVLCGKPSGCSPSSTGTGEVSMSWGVLEFPGETLAVGGQAIASDGTTWYTSDPIFTTNNGTGTGGSGTGNPISGVVYLAASGDDPGTSYPCTSPYVVCVGGTLVGRNQSSNLGPIGNFEYEYAWDLAGGGASLYEPLPSYQSSVGNIPILTGISGFRATPDVAADADPFTGAWIYDSYPFGYDGDYSFYGWVPVAGTSLSTVLWAGIVNSAGSFAASGFAENANILYPNRGSSTNFRKINNGTCGPYSGMFGTPGWNPCGGIGSPQGYGDK